MWKNNERHKVLHKYGGLLLTPRQRVLHLLSNRPIYWKRKTRVDIWYLPFPKIKNRTVMLTNIQENPKNCTRLYMNRYPFFKLIRAEKQSKVVNCYKQWSQQERAVGGILAWLLPLSYLDALSSHTNTWPTSATAWAPRLAEKHIR